MNFVTAPRQRVRKICQMSFSTAKSLGGTYLKYFQNGNNEGERPMKSLSMANIGFLFRSLMLCGIHRLLAVANDNFTSI
jgi:hypothetical protein